MIPNQTNMTFFTDIDVKTTLDVNFKYYDITDNKVTQPIHMKLFYCLTEHLLYACL